MPYPSDLTDREWAILEPLLPKHPAKGQPWRYPLRMMVNAMFYILRSGCAWRMLPHEFPPWETVYSRYRLWNKRGVWHKVLDVLRSRARELEGRDPEPSAVIIDSQSAKTTEKGGYAGSTRGKRSLAASATSLSAQTVSSSRSRSTRRTSRTRLAPKNCSRA